MATCRRTAAGPSVVFKDLTTRVLPKKASIQRPHSCVPHRKLTLLDAFQRSLSTFQRSLPKGQLVSAAGSGLTSP
jgi:hypothetical protein